jgi:hypothetical protein
MVSEATGMTARTSARATVRWAGLLALLAPVACAQMLDIPSDPALVATGPWRCLNQSPAVATPAAAAQAKVRVQACNFISDCTTAASGLTAYLCDKRDVGCINPRLTGLTDSNGEFTFQVPTAGGGFDGYLLVDSQAASCTDSAAFGSVAGKMLCDLVAPTCDLTAPDMRCFLKIYAPAMLFFNPPVVADMEAPLPLQLFPTSGLPAVISAAGIQVNPMAGNLFIQALDCDGKPAAGVTYRIAQFSNQVSPLYVNNGIVSESVTQTDATGVGGFVGVPPGFVSVTGYNSEGVAIGEIGVQAAPSVLTYSALLPK